MQAIKNANRQAFEGSSGRIVAVFVGGTSGIGEYTAKTLAKYSAQPNIYLVGRSETAASRIRSEIEALNPKATTTFIQADVAKLSAVDKVSDEIKSKEQKLNILFMTQGFMAIESSRNETEEGLDKKMALHYYSRVRFALNLLPLLKAGASDDDSSPVGARVISVLSPGTEGPINENDLELKQSYGLKAAADHCTSFNSFAIETLAAENPNIGWMHAYPSFVNTNLARDLAWWWKLMVKAISPLAVSSQDSGEGFTRLLTDPKRKAGLGLVSWDGSDKDTRKDPGSMQFAIGGRNWWSEDRRKLVWAHTQEVMGRVGAAGAKS